jgi:hypothetical protein
MRTAACPAHRGPMVMLLSHAPAVIPSRKAQKSARSMNVLMCFCPHRIFG